MKQFNKKTLYPISEIQFCIKEKKNHLTSKTELKVNISPAGQSHAICFRHRPTLNQSQNKQVSRKYVVLV